VSTPTTIPATSNLISQQGKRSSIVENDRLGPLEDQHPSKSGDNRGLRFIGVELAIFGPAVLVFLIGLSVILFLYFSR
jgi:hypothetical protein